MPNGLILQADDMEVGKYVAVLRWKHRNVPVPFSGQAIRITALRLPFLVGQPMRRGARPVTLDTRFFAFTLLPEEYVNAQFAASK